MSVERATQLQAEMTERAAGGLAEGGHVLHGHLDGQLEAIARDQRRAPPGFLPF